MKKLSLCMIVKNEAENLDNALKNAKDYADEIVIVDTGSTDNTKEIASKYTSKVYDFEWVNDFAKARNYSFDMAENDYLMWLDGDDIVLDDSVHEIKKWKENGEDCDVLMCRYVASFDENYNPTFEYYRERIIKNSKKLRWKDRVHEVISPLGKVIRNSKIAIYHNKKKEGYSQRNLNIYRDMLAKGEAFSPRNRFYYARELFFHGLHKEAVHEFSKYLAEDKGWKENNIEACLNMAKCYEALGEEKKALSTLFGSFVYGLPKGEVLYQIGNIFVSMKEYKNAIYWFKEAMQSEMNIEGGGFVDQNCYNFLPAMQLCMCYSRLGDNLEAYKYHTIAKELQPNDERVKYNEQFFNHLFNEKKED